MLTAVNRNKLLQKPHLVCRIIGIPTLKLSNCVTSATIRKAHIILNDPDHPLHLYFIPLPSGCRCRLCVGGLTSKSFVPTAICALNTLAIILHSCICCVFFFCFFLVGYVIVLECIVTSSYILVLYTHLLRK